MIKDFLINKFKRMSMIEKLKNIMHNKMYSQDKRFQLNYITLSLSDKEVLKDLKVAENEYF